MAHDDYSIVAGQPLDNGKKRKSLIMTGLISLPVFWGGISPLLTLFFFFLLCYVFPPYFFFPNDLVTV